jgi:hypothetical protein
MEQKIEEEKINLFLSRVIEIEEKYAFAKQGQNSARKDELRNVLEEMCKD